MLAPQLEPGDIVMVRTGHMHFLRIGERDPDKALTPGDTVLLSDLFDPLDLAPGTEFGLFFTQDGGDNWRQLKGNFPTISVRDIEIQRRETDLVVGTFGRGIYILDDYSPLRTAAGTVESKDAHLFAVKDPWLYVEGDLWDGREKGSMGAEFFSAPNPPFGAVFTYHLKDGLKTRRERRHEAEKEAGGFDAVFMACHSDQALGMLADATTQEREVLGAIGYQRNEAVLHTDTSVLPSRRAAWAGVSPSCIPPPGRHHHLVTAQSRQRLGDQHLSLYRFQHFLIIERRDRDRREPAEQLADAQG